LQRNKHGAALDDSERPQVVNWEAEYKLGKLTPIQGN